MPTKQINIFLPNEPGQLSIVSDLLGASGINVKAVSIAVSNVESDLSTMSVVLDDHKRGKLILESHSYNIEEKVVIAAYAPDHPGGLNAVMKPLKEAGVNVEKIYISAARKGENAVLILEVDDYEKGVAALKANYVQLIEDGKLF